MNTNELLVKIIHKHDIEENWNKVPDFIPSSGEIIVYDVDENHTYSRIKLGDGQTRVIDLPFYLAEERDDIEAMTEEEILAITGSIPGAPSNPSGQVLVEMSAQDVQNIIRKEI